MLCNVFIDNLIPYVTIHLYSIRGSLSSFAAVYKVLCMMANASSYDDSVNKCYDRHELTSEDKRYAATYLNETDETRESAVAEIKRWIEESDDIHARMGKIVKIAVLYI